MAASRQAINYSCQSQTVAGWMQSLAGCRQKYFTNVVWGCASKALQRPLLKTHTVSLLHESRLPTAIQKRNISKGTNIYEDLHIKACESADLSSGWTNPALLHSLQLKERTSQGKSAADNPLNSKWRWWCGRTWLSVCLHTTALRERSSWRDQEGVRACEHLLLSHLTPVVLLIARTQHNTVHTYCTNIHIQICTHTHTHKSLAKQKAAGNLHPL